MEDFLPHVRAWFEATYASPTRVQREGWPVLARGAHALLIAPTGSGKTLAAFLWGLDRLSRLDPEAKPGVRILYVSPLKALVYDVERNLRTPLGGIHQRGLHHGSVGRRIRVDVRTGDTSAKERRTQIRNPADVLATTPESLFLILGSRAAASLATVHTVVVDEIHALAGTKRGAHLALSLERLSEIASRDPQRIGLSATVHPAGPGNEVAKFLGGDRQVEIVDASEPAHVDLSVRVPVPDMTEVAAAGAMPGTPEPGSLWSRIYPEILHLVRGHRSTIVFVNSRSLAERLAQRLNEIAGEPLVRAHHGSLSHSKRSEIEEALKRGDLRGIVATSSLELGIDMGAVDLVVLVESPGSVARGLQRVGRSGHSVGEKSRGVIFPKFRGDLLECAVVAERMLQGALEPVHVPRNALDVLAQQIVALCAERPRRVDEIESLFRRAHPYRDLSRELLVSVIEMLSGHYPEGDWAELRPRLAWDRARDVVSPRAGAKMISLLNAGTIPDRGLYAVHLGERGPRIGELDEEMVYETRRGETFYLGASTWRVEAITRDRVIVAPAPGEPGRTPFWRGDGPGRPIELGRAVGRFTREIAERKPEDALSWLSHPPLDADAARNLLRYVEEQQEHAGSLPTDHEITVERFQDELGCWRIAILTPFGARIHAPWALAVQNLLSRRAGFEVETMYTDDGIALRFDDVDDLPSLDALIPGAEEVEERVVEELAGSALFAATFRESAARALLLPRRHADRRTPLWQQRLRAKNLLAAVRRYPSFPIVLESYRHCLQDVFDLPALKHILLQIERGEVTVREVETRSPSPFARSLIFAYVASYLYERDAPLAERRAQALALDRRLLRDLLGEAELRELIDGEVLAELEEELSGRAPGYRARNPDELEDLLRRVGDLNEAELGERATEDPKLWLRKLSEERRVAEVTVAGEARYVSASDETRYHERPASLEGLVVRYARTHGPFLTDEVAERFGVASAPVESILERLETEGRILRGELRPSGSSLEWCDPDVLRRLKRRTLEKLRKQAAPVEPSVLGRFLPGWHGLDEQRRGIARIEEVIAQLEGLPLPWSSLVEGILPLRVADFRPEMLDLVAASGSVVWVGAGALGREGRITLYRRERAALLLPEPEPYEPGSDLEAHILATLERRGASFTVELAPRSDELSLRSLEEALASLLWAGQITNDTFFPLWPLRNLGKSKRGPSRRAGAPRYAGGRWSLVESLRDASLSDTERIHARVTMLLERYGVVCRSVAQHEGVSGGYASMYPLLREMEERGRLRRGHFVEGLSGAQFALAGAVERLRAARESREEQTRAFLAVDPANPYGALLPWPDRPEEATSRPRRIPGAWVVLHQGELVLFLERGGRSLLTFGRFSQPAVARAAIEQLKSLPRRRPHRIRVGSIDDAPPARSPYAALLSEAGFFREAQSMVYAEHPGLGR